jgi:hypothetical protein
MGKLMQPNVPELMAELYDLIGALGKDGGLISPSIYDTAQVTRLSPLPGDKRPALEWLLRQQQPDGGWGTPTTPRTRDVPTLAAILALHATNPTAEPLPAVQAGLAFLRTQAKHWAEPLPDDIPSGVELILPKLLEDAATLNLDIPRKSYAALFALHYRRRQLLRASRPTAGSTAAISWETWGEEPDPAMIDGSGGVGHSPAATAAWLQCAAIRADLALPIETATRFLHQASLATGAGVPGVMPFVWPIDRFEQSFGLYALLVTHLLDHPIIQDAVQRPVAELAQALTPNGLGHSDFFNPDGDDTAATLAVLLGMRQPVDIAPLQRFAVGDHFCTWPGELQSSISVTARAVQTLALAGLQAERSLQLLTERQESDGRWSGDKWNCSWIYTTWHVILALLAAKRYQPLPAALDALCAAQNADGGWGNLHATSSLIETAYAVLALYALETHGLLGTTNQATFQRGQQALLELNREAHTNDVQCWLGKEMYRPQRVDRAFEISAMLTTIHRPTEMAWNARQVGAMRH